MKLSAVRQMLSYIRESDRGGLTERRKTKVDAKLHECSSKFYRAICNMPDIRTLYEELEYLTCEETAEMENNAFDEGFRIGLLLAMDALLVPPASFSQPHRTVSQD